MMFISVGFMVVGIILFAVKIASIVLACKMSRMLVAQRANNLAHPVVKKSPHTKASAPSVPQQPQIMYVPINMAPQMNPNSIYGPYNQPFYPMYNPYIQQQFQNQFQPNFYPQVPQVPQVPFGSPRQQV